jgi:polyisoprenoid-binding protein YceI
MTLAPGTHTIGPTGGTVQVRTYREGVAQQIGHDLIIDVGQWQATVDVLEDGRPAAISIEVDPTSLRVREGLRGLKPLSDKDRDEIRRNIDGKVLHGQPISFRSSTVQGGAGRLTVSGELTLAGATRPATYDLNLGEDGRVTGTLQVTQSKWGIKPYRGLLGALKVRDDVEVVIDLALRTQ